MCCLTGVPLLETVYLAAFLRWAWKRCVHTGADDSQTWEAADIRDFEPIPRMCRLVLAVYEKDLDKPMWAPPGGYQIEVQNVIKRVDNHETSGMAPPYLIYIDHQAKDIVLAIRGLSLRRESDYAVLLDNKLGQEMFEGGYVHHGLHKSAVWVLEKEARSLQALVSSYPEYTLTFTGHSLGSGVAALLTLVSARNRHLIGNIPRKQIRCYAIAPARCVSLNLAVRSADIINSVVLQELLLQSLDLFLKRMSPTRLFTLKGEESEDDFMPRTATPLEDMFKCVFWYGRFPPHVKTAVPVDGRFEQVIISCNATSDHSIICIEREAQKALELMIEKDRMTNIPPRQKMERERSIQLEHAKECKDAIQRAISLNVPHASGQLYGTFI